MAVYFVVWWLVLFTTLPVGVRNASEAGEVVTPGTETGAPVKHMMGWKILATSIISGVIVGSIHLLVVFEVFDLRAYLTEN